MIRIFDIFSSILGLLILSPLLIPIIVILRLTGEKEIFYFQDRVGINGEIFQVYKFATMLKDSATMGSGTITVANDPRVLPLGRVLRKTKINELPQLLNVVRGEMSLIGPRPHAPRDLQGVDSELLQIVQSIRPGLSGVASIIFRNEDKILHDVSDPRKFYDTIIAPYKARVDIWYRQNISFSKYLILIILTVIVVLTGRIRIIFLVFPDIPEVPHDLKALL